MRAPGHDWFLFTSDWMKMWRGFFLTNRVASSKNHSKSYVYGHSNKSIKQQYDVRVVLVVRTIT